MKTLKQGLLLTGVTLLFLNHSPTLLDFRPAAHSITSSPLIGPFEINSKLNEAEHLFKDSIRGPESIVIHKGEIITGTEDGTIVKIQDNDVIPLAKTGRHCDMPYEERLCGRPLGLRLWKDGHLYVIDGYYGLHRLNISTGLLTRLLSSSTYIDGRKMTFPDDLDIDENGNVYFSDASSKWDLSSMLYMIAEHDMTGRVIKHNIYSAETEVILKELSFPNGIQLSRDGNSLLICEIIRRRILRYHLKGPRKGQVDIFIDNLPGEPDNIRLSPRGTYWVALFQARNKHFFTELFDSLGQYPSVLRICARANHALGTVAVAIADMLSSHTLKEYAYKMKRGDFLLALIPRHGIVLELDENGKILRTFQSPDGTTASLSQATEHDGYLYLGSVQNRYLGRLKL